jgi:hypothetical protein
VLLGERLAGALVLGAAPGPLAPHQPDRAPEAGHINQHDIAATVAADQHATGQAAHRRGRRLDHDLEAGGLLDDLEDLEPVQADEQIAVVAVGGIRGEIGT